MRQNKILPLDNLVVAAVQNVLDQEVDQVLKQNWLRENSWFEDKLAAVAEAEREEEKVVCPYFLKGKCSHPTSCRWLHPGAPQQRLRDVPSNPPIRSQSLPLGQHSDTRICPLFGQGLCTFGNSCPLKHPVSQQSMVHYDHYDPYGLRMALHSFTQPFTDSSAPPQPNRYPPPSYIDDFPQSNEHCRMWQESYCGNDACPFLHVGPPGGEYAGQRSVGARREYSKERTKVPESSGKICRYWQRGSCFLKDCIFPHIGPSGSQQQQQESPDGDANLKRPVPSYYAGESNPALTKRTKSNDNYPR